MIKRKLVVGEKLWHKTLGIVTVINTCGNMPDSPSPNWGIMVRENTKAVYLRDLEDLVEHLQTKYNHKNIRCVMANTGTQETYPSHGGPGWKEDEIFSVCRVVVNKVFPENTLLYISPDHLSQYVYMDCAELVDDNTVTVTVPANTPMVEVQEKLTTASIASLNKTKENKTMTKYFKLRKDTPELVKGAILQLGDGSSTVATPIGTVWNQVEDDTQISLSSKVMNSKEWFERVYPATVDGRTVYTTKDRARELFEDSLADKPAKK